ncbi:MAG: hypothetical protein J6T29_02620 [Alphaproteobacteria bacterium]|nr:hypothetical protein [Alphaproteobacteria bacterium]
MKKALIIANMLFASATVWGMNESLVNQENSGNVFVEVKDLSEHEQGIRAQIILQICKVGHGTNFKKIDDNFEAAKDALSSPDVLVLQNEKPSTSQKINPRILNSVDQDGNTLLSYTIKSFYNIIHLKCQEGWDPSWNREKLLLLSNYMLEYGADPFLKMSDKNGPFENRIKERIEEYELAKYCSEQESEALKKLLSSYKEAVKNWKIV